MSQYDVNTVFLMSRFSIPPLSFKIPSPCCLKGSQHHPPSPLSPLTNRLPDVEVLNIALALAAILQDNLVPIVPCESPFATRHLSDILCVDKEYLA